MNQQARYLGRVTGCLRTGTFRDETKRLNRQPGCACAAFAAASGIAFEQSEHRGESLTDRGREL